jgi:tetracycline resistance efflux pump
MYGTAWSLLPPVVAIVLALITKEVYSSLFIGIVTGALIYTGFSPVATLDTVINEGFIQSVASAWNIGIFMFLILLGAMVALMNKAGGSAAFGEWAQQHVKTRRGALLATFLLGVMIFVDDYFNCLTVGSVMMPVTDGHKISRAKLAYVIDATAAPICMIAPISSWAAAVSGMVDEGVYSGIELFVRAIPYNYYSLLTIVFVIGLAVMGFDYGPMAKHEKNARENGDLFTEGERVGASLEVPQSSGKGKVYDLLIPVVVLIVCCILGMIYVGGFFQGAGFIDAFSATDASVGLPWGSLIALLFAVVYYICRRLVSFKEAMSCLTAGFNAMVPAMLILSFAVTLKTMTGLLGADVYVAGLMQGASSSLTHMLPAIIFLVACFLAFASGTSWGTFGILIPIVTSVFTDASTGAILPGAEHLIIIGISACLAGAVMGDHCSPISDTTIMASAGAQCWHINHVNTQIPYVLTVAAVSFVTYIVAGFVENAVISLLVGIALMLGTMAVLQKTIGTENR